MLRNSKPLLVAIHRGQQGGLPTKCYGALMVSGDLPSLSISRNTEPEESIRFAFAEIFEGSTSVQLAYAADTWENIWTSRCFWSYYRSQGGPKERIAEENPSYLRMIERMAQFGEEGAPEDPTIPLLPGVWVYMAMEREIAAQEGG